jgi:uncharacterized membrane protein YfcA
MALVLLAGVAAGAINAVVGSGTLVTFPTLLALGVPPVTANVSNNIGLVPGSFSGAWGYRRELRDQGRRLRRLVPASALGGVTGALLLLVLPSAAFDAIVPALVLLGIVLVVVQPWISRRVRGTASHSPGSDTGPVWLVAAVFATGIYGGYFGAAQGILLMAVLGVGLGDTMQRNNAAKNVLAGVVNGVAALVFLTAGPDWRVVALIAVGSTVGGQLGAVVGRRLPAPVLRAVIVVVGCTALAVFLTQD